MPVADTQQDLIKFVAKLEEEATLELAQRCLADGTAPLAILDLCHKGMTQVGKLYDQGIYYVSALIMAGEIMRRVGELVLPFVEGKSENLNTGSILLGTVEGDIDLIGKDIFKTLVQGYGFTVRDLGVDVPSSRFLAAMHELKTRHSRDVVPDHRRPGSDARDYCFPKTACSSGRISSCLHHRRSRQRGDMQAGGGRLLGRRCHGRRPFMSENSGGRVYRGIACLPVRPKVRSYRIRSMKSPTASNGGAWGTRLNEEEQMANDSEALFKERQQRIQDAIALRVPDRVPIWFQDLGFFPARYGGITYKEAMYDSGKLFSAYKKTIMETRSRHVFQPWALHPHAGRRP